MKNRKRNGTQSTKQSAKTPSPNVGKLNVSHWPPAMMGLTPHTAGAGTPRSGDKMKPGG